MMRRIKQLNVERGMPKLFGLYFSFYACVAIFGGYLNLYLDSIGLNEAQIGAIVSISTIVTFFSNLFWSTFSDKTSAKTRIVGFLFLLTALTCLLFYLGSSFAYLILIVSLFSLFFNPIMPLNDTVTLEILEDKNTDYGRIRMGGTIGYMITAFVIGQLLNDAYQHIFWMMMIPLLICWGIYLTYPRIQGYGKQVAPGRIASVPRNKLFICIILFNFVFAMTMTFYYSFYPIYFVSIGGNSGLVGTIMFASALSEIPMLFLMRRYTERIGIEKVLFIAAILTAIRWFLLSFLTNPFLIIVVSLLHGVGYTSFSYSVITFIGKVVPRHLRARGQTLYIMAGQVLPRIVFGYVGGLMSAYMGVQRVFWLNASILAVSAIVFLLVVGKPNLVKSGLEPLQ